jgi:Type II secretion system (T2SS), protein G
VAIGLVVLALVAVILIHLPPRGYRLDDKTKVQLDRVRELVQEWQRQRGRLPTDAEGIDVLVQAGLATEDGITDGWGGRLKYRCSNQECLSAMIYSSGPNKIDEHGGGDDLTLQLPKERCPHCAPSERRMN